MERVWRIIFLGLFVLGFIGAVASADRTGEDSLAESPVVSLIRDVRMAEEINDINKGRWNADAIKENSLGLSRVEALLTTQELMEKNKNRDHLQN